MCDDAARLFSIVHAALSRSSDDEGLARPSWAFARYGRLHNIALWINSYSWQAFRRGVHPQRWKVCRPASTVVFACRATTRSNETFSRSPEAGNRDNSVKSCWQMQCGLRMRCFASTMCFRQQRAGYRNMESAPKQREGSALWPWDCRSRVRLHLYGAARVPGCASAMKPSPAPLGRWRNCRRTKPASFGRITTHRCFHIAGWRNRLRARWTSLLQAETVGPMARVQVETLLRGIRHPVARPGAKIPLRPPLEKTGASSAPATR